MNMGNLVPILPAPGTEQNVKTNRGIFTLDLIAEPIKEHEKSVIIDKADGEKFLPVVAIYGPNGGGKSTVLEALIYFAIFVSRPFVISRNASQIKQPF